MNGSGARVNKEPMRILHVIADPMPPEEAVNRRVAEAFFSTLRDCAPWIDVDTFDLYAAPPPFFDYPLFRFLWYPMLKPGYEPTPSEKVAGRVLAEMSARFNAADALVLTAPVWNYSMPAILKAWIDVTIAPNYSFRFVNGQREPLHRVRRLYFFLSSGGSMGHGKVRDSLMHQLQTTFSYIGIDDVTTVFADCQDPALYPDFRQRELSAIAQAQALARALPVAARADN